MYGLKDRFKNLLLLMGVVVSISFFLKINCVLAATFTTPFTVGTNYTMDSEVEVIGGMARLKTVTSDQTGTGIATASSFYATGNNTPDKAFDDQTGSSGWGNNHAMPSWLQYDFGAGNNTIVTEYTLYRNSGQTGGWNSNNYSPRDWTFEGSNDGATWVTLDTQTAQLIAVNAVKTEYSIANTVAYRFYRINISSSVATSWVNITEMELVGPTNVGTFIIYKTSGDTNAQLRAFTGFTVTEGTVQGTLNYQLSSDGINWKYWDGSAWANAGATDYNTEAVINTNISSFSTAGHSIYAKVFMTGNSAQALEIDEMQIDYSVNSAPTITSASTVDVVENTTAVITVTSIDSDAGDTVTYTITGGADQSKFSIVGTTGVLTFNTAPDFEAKGSAAGDNIYKVEVTATDSGALTDSQIIAVTVTDADEDDADDDGDGVTNGEENIAPNGDGNGDGIKDSIQDSVTTNANSETGTYTTIVAEGGCSIINGYKIIDENNLAIQDKGYSYPVGLNNFTLQCTNSGDSATVTFFYDKVYDTKDWKYRKYHSNSGIFSDISSIITYGTANVNGVTVTTSTYTLTDGIDTDTDGLINGEIKDPAGPATESSLLGTASIGNYIWLDKNGDGKQDDNELGLENIRVKLIGYGPNGKYDHGKKDDVVWRTDTNHNGHYLFENLPEGEYKVIVKEEDVVQYIQTYDPDSKMDGRDTIKLKNGRHYTKADFGYNDREAELARTGDNWAVWLMVMLVGIIIFGDRKRIEARK